MIRQSFILIGLCLILSGQVFSNETLGKITGEVVLNIKDQQLFGKLKYDYVAGVENETEVKFFLNENFDVGKVKCSKCQSFNFDRQAKPIPTLTISLKESLSPNEHLAIEIEYKGSFKDMYSQEHSFLELGLDNFWYPVHRNTSQFNFLYSLNVKTDVPDFQLISNGKTTKKEKNWLIESKVPDFDIDLVFADKLIIKSNLQNGYNLQIVSKNLPDETSNALLTGITETLNFYNSTFGKNNPQREITAVFRPFTGNNGQGGYFRKGYFILPKLNDAETAFLPIAHELAHFWWIKAPQQHAWLNESFAEYSAMLAVRKLKGIEKFNEIIERKKKNNVNLPAVYGFDRTKNRQQSPLVLYVKGTLKLSELENELGEEDFLLFLQKVAKEQVKDTDKLIELLSTFSSSEVAARFLAKLKE